MIKKALSIVLVIFSLLGYLEWGEDNTMFLFQAEVDIFKKVFTDFGSIAHPFVLLPLLGQILLIYTAFQNPPKKLLVYLGIGCITLLLGLMLFIGIISSNLKILLSTLPFLLTSIVTIVHHQRKSKVSNV
ncbi:MAG: hypothetical protein P1U56_22245 [Saprospiraceae bacterium]|nr:hypothetical protein [Saprospiraceae bacterium]